MYMYVIQCTSPVSLGAEIPAGFVAQAIHGFVEELVVNDDPEYKVYTLCV